jgi:hypothetical protein
VAHDLTPLVTGVDDNNPHLRRGRSLERSGTWVGDR